MNAEFAKDLINAQSEITTLPKDKKGYGYNYTDFDTVVKTVKPILKKNHLGFCQLLDTKDNGKSGITTILFHESGESFQSWFELPASQVSKVACQNMGASITYIKRYALCAVLGCSSDEDTDAVTLSAPNTSSGSAGQSRPQNYQNRPNNNGYQNRPQNAPNNGGQYR